MLRPRLAVLLACAATVLAGAGAALHDPPAPRPPAFANAPVAPPPPPGAIKRVVIVVEENKDYGRIAGAPDAPVINALAARGTLLTSYYAIRHPSLPNYLAILAGDTFGIEHNCTDCTVSALSLVDQLEAAGISWKAYLQGLPAPCSDVARAGNYAKKHNPFLYFDRVRHDEPRCAKVVAFDEFGADLASGRLPQFAFVVPDQAHDMHDGPVAAGDAWLGSLYEQLAASSAWREDTRLVVTFDEASGDQTCCAGLASGGRIATVVVGPAVPAGVVDATEYTHYDLLHSVESLFGLGYLGHAGDPRATDIPSVSG